MRRAMGLSVSGLGIGFHQGWIRQEASRQGFKVLRVSGAQATGTLASRVLKLNSRDCNFEDIVLLFGLRGALQFSTPRFDFRALVLWAWGL